MIIVHFGVGETESQSDYVPIKVTLPFMERRILPSSFPRGLVTLGPHPSSTFLGPQTHMSVSVQGR